MSSIAAASTREAAASLAALSAVPALLSTANPDPTIPNNGVVCCAGSLCRMNGSPLLVMHLCAECGGNTHGSQCAYHIPEDMQIDNEDGVVVNASLLSQGARDSTAKMVCIPCYKKTHEDGFVANALSTDADGSNMTVPSASASSKDFDLLKNLYTLNDVEVTTQATNSTVAIKSGKLPDASKCTRLKGFRTSTSDGVQHSHTVAEVNLNQLQKFATYVGVKGQRRAKKVEVCEAIVERKAARDRALATGEQEVIDQHGRIITFNRVRGINVLTSSEFRPYLLKMDAPLSAKDLTNNIKANEVVMRKFVKLYNNNNPKFANINFEDTGIAQDPGEFAQLPDSYWKTALKNIKKLGKEYEDAITRVSGDHEAIAEKLAASSNPSLAYFHEALGGNPDLAKQLTVQLPDDVFAESTGTSDIVKRGRVGARGRSCNTKPGSGKGRKKRDSGGDRMAAVAASGMAERNASIAYKADTEAHIHVTNQLEVREKEHNNILASLVNHCGSKEEAVCRIRRVKAQVQKNNSLDKFCYDSDAGSDSDAFSPPCSQEENIKSLLRKRKDMDELRKRADAIKSRL